MKQILITQDFFYDDEANQINDFLDFDENIFRIHIRKPQAKKDDYANLLKKIKKENLSKITIHDYFDLANDFVGIGINLNQRNNFVPNGFCGFVSQSCHSLKELEFSKKNTNYQFLSPIFDSISKKGYKSNFDLIELKNNIFVDKNTIALGGVNAQNVAILTEIGFGGFATLWRKIL